jgi:hypothetical protein
VSLGPVFCLIVPVLTDTNFFAIILRQKWDKRDQ